MSVPVIAFFNNKGGVGKTTLVYHLAWMYRDLGRRVLAVDLDPQANLTAAFLDEPRLEELWPEQGPRATIFGDVEPLTTGVGDVLREPHVEVLGDTLAGGELTLIPGDLRLSRFEDELSQNWSPCLDGKERAFRVTSAFWRVIQAAASMRRAEFALIDLGPNLGAINRAALVSADYLAIPLVPDLFSLMGLENLGPAMRQWREEWRQRREKNPSPQLGLPAAKIQPIGYILMQHAERLSRPAKAYARWASRIPETYRRELLAAGPAADGNELASLKHYRSLMPMAQEARKPVFHLKTADGAMGSHQALVQQAFQAFEHLAGEILSRCGIASEP